jgi:uncharacterized protein YyaL (SSP411 family)
MPNALAAESSPYLLQHANNPVDWHPWGPEALARARAEDKPIFLSIGYSACHWCHVMEHESFEDDAIARLLNEHFVSIKVDREERPDLDHVYMTAVQAISGRGGWPMSVFLTPDLEPFFGGTYWPPTSRMGMPGFDRVLGSVIDAWQNRRDQAVEQARDLAQKIREATAETSPGELSAAPLRSAEAMIERIFDHRHGGFGGAPKFPHPMDLRVLLRAWRRHPREELLKMVTLTLDKMAAGGIYDHLAGGFHRYSVDERWLVPHFEKMLYDNALLAVCYLEAWQATGDTAHATTVRETLDYILREMTDAQGGFHSTQDADSEGVEGKFYVWRPAEIERVLGAAAAKTFCYCYDVSDEGNFEEANILNRPKTLDQCAQILSRDPAELAAELAQSRQALLAVRSQRIAPALDDKVLVNWNALMIDALAQAGAVLGEPRYLAAARRAAEFILTELRRPDGRLLHAWRNGRARFDAYLDDYAYLINALVMLYESDFDETWIDRAVELADVLLARFADPAGGGFYYTADDHEQLFTRHKDAQDSSVPSGNGMAATALLRLGKLTGRADYLTAAESTLAAFVGLMQQHPTAAGQLLLALDFHQGPTPELVLIGNPAATDTAAVLGEFWRRFVPNRVVACRATGNEAGSPNLADLFAGKTLSPPAPNMYVCEHFTCQAPAKGREAVLKAIDELTPR